MTLFVEFDLLLKWCALTTPQSLLAGISTVALLTNTFTGGATEDWDPIVPAGGAAAGVELLQVLIPGPLQIVLSGTNVVGGCTEAH